MYYISYKQSGKQYYFAGPDGKKIALDLKTAMKVLSILKEVHKEVKLEPDK